MPFVSFWLSLPAVLLLPEAYCVAQYLQMLLIVFFTVSVSVQRMLVMPTGEGMFSESGFRHGKACKAVLLKGVF